jgi:AraC-like DNA-binding protein
MRNFNYYLINHSKDCYGRMIFQSYQPVPALKEFVKSFRIRHFIVPAGMKTYPKPYPSHPENCITFYVKGRESKKLMSDGSEVEPPRSAVTGQFTHRVNRSALMPEHLMIIIVFKPGALYKLTGIPSRELVNRHIDLEDIYPQKARAVNNTLQYCKVYTDMIGVIESFLLDLLVNVKVSTQLFENAFSLMATQPASYSIDWIAGQACLSPRQFERKAGDYLGISPKLFARTAKFHQSFCMRLKQPSKTWFDIAMDSGYYDYQHLVKDYKEFASATPNELFNEEAKSLDKALGLSRKIIA